MKAVLFDLDDTLYPETDFVRSGFAAVAAYLNSRYQFDKTKLITQMLDMVKKDGRGKVFNTLLEELKLCTQERVQLLVYIYRSHTPRIRLYDDVVPVLKHLKRNKIKLGLITDGMASVQKNKIAALGLKKLLDINICCDELGKENWKPSIVPFKAALEFLEVPAPQAVYVGDNVSKDFIAPNTLGMLSIQIKRAPVATNGLRDASALHCAKVIIKNLNELLPIIKQGEK